MMTIKYQLCWAWSAGNLHSAEGSSCTRETSYKALSTDSYRSTGAFEPEALGNCGKISFLQEKPTWRRKHFVLRGWAKKVATHYNFGGNLNEALRDALVCGLRNMQIQKRFLSEAKLKYSKAVEIAVAMELPSAMLQNYKVSSTQSLTLTSWLKATKQHQQNRWPLPIATTVVGTHIWRTIVFTRTRFATTVENRAIFSEFVVPNSKAKASLNIVRHPKNP